MKCHPNKIIRRPASKPLPINFHKSGDFGKVDFSRKFEDDYTLGRLLGTGSTSTCHLCMRKRPTSHHHSQNTFACKIIDKNMINDKYKGLLEQFEMEITLLKALRHPNIIHLEDVFHSSTRIHMVMEYMRGGELFDYIVKRGYLNELEASGLVLKISSAIAYMHENNIVHRDLKPGRPAHCGGLFWLHLTPHLNLNLNLTALLVCGGGGGGGGA
jgi:serine/threonine protein kinase